MAKPTSSYSLITAPTLFLRNTKIPVVAIWPPTLLPFNCSREVTLLPAGKITPWTILKYGIEKSNCFCLSGVMVVEDATISYWPVATPPKIPSQAIFLFTTLKPAALATSLM